MTRESRPYLLAYPLWAVATGLTLALVACKPESTSDTPRPNIVRDAGAQNPGGTK